MSIVPPLHIAAFTGGANEPSARFRVRQYIPALEAQGIELTETWPRLKSFPPATRWLRPVWFAGTVAERMAPILAGRAADVTLLQREMVSTLVTLEGLTRRPRLLDIDDAIHLHRGGRTARRLAGLADLVVVGNDWLEEAWRRWTPHTSVLPTAVDTDAIRPAPPPEAPVIGWIGTAGNLRYLAAIGDAFAVVARRFPDAVLAICCDRPPVAPLPIRTRFIPWSPAAELRFLEDVTLGLMPLADGPWERGKCSFKMLQYMAAGRPSVVSPVGLNGQILARGPVGLAAGDWAEAISALLADPAAAGRMGLAGRALALAEFSVAALAPRLGGLLRGLA